MLYKTYYRANSLKDVVDRLATSNGEKLRLHAGGTDLMLQLHEGLIEADGLVDIADVAELKIIRQEENTVRLGAAVTYTEMIDSQILNQHAHLLVDASKLIGASQIQNMGTVGGNLGNASPAGDTLPCLYALEAEVVLARAGGERRVPVDRFFQGYRQIDLQPEELIQELNFQLLEADTGSSFIKFGLRKSQAISLVMVATVIQVRQNRITKANVALGAVAPTIVRSPSAEAILIGARPSGKLFSLAGEAAQQDIHPIDDIRAGAEFRRHLTGILVYRALKTACDQIPEER